MSEKSKAPWLGRPITWAAVLLAGLIGSVMTFSYLGGFLDPVGELSDAPVAYVNEDAGANVAGTQMDLGQAIQQQLTAAGGGEFDWQILESQEEAERRLRDNDLWGAIVVPKTFSEDVGNIGVSAATPGAPPAPQAKVALLTNEGAGLFQPSVFARASEAALSTISTEANTQLVGMLDQAQLTVSPDAALALGQPVVADEQAVIALPEKSGRGVAPFYLAVMISLTGFLAASIANIAIDLQRGAEKLELFGREIDLNVGDGSAWVLWQTKVLLTVIGAALGGLLAV
ncbi:MAG: YhgE/Pip domain-containing protein, partial [Acidimicrobiales bacterium]